MVLLPSYNFDWIKDYYDHWKVLARKSQIRVILSNFSVLFLSIFSSYLIALSSSLSTLAIRLHRHRYRCHQLLQGLQLSLQCLKLPAFLILSASILIPYYLETHPLTPLQMYRRSNVGSNFIRPSSVASSQSVSGGSPGVRASWIYPLTCKEELKDDLPRPLITTFPFPSAS